MGVFSVFGDCQKVALKAKVGQSGRSRYGGGCGVSGAGERMTTSTNTANRLNECVGPGCDVEGESWGKGRYRFDVSAGLD